MPSAANPYVSLALTGNGDQAPPEAPYGGESYYGLPAVKAAHYRWLIVWYFFIGGVASAAQFIATAIDLFGRPQDRPLVRAGRYLALAGALASPGLLAADILTPARWYNMLRIFRSTSPMSIGSWALATFGLFSGVSAAGQAVEDLTGWRAGTWLARLAGFPAAVAGGVVSLYTGTLLEATSIPFWSGAFPFLSSLFAGSAATSATAALSLAGEVARVPESSHRRLDAFALVAAVAEFVFSLLVSRNWRERRVAAPVQQAPLSLLYHGGVQGVGLLFPIAVHAIQALSGRRWPRLSRLAAFAALLAGFALRAVLVFGGKPSAHRPQDYFAVTQPAGAGRGPRA